MPEIQSIKPSAFPSWVMLDRRFRIKGQRSFRADDETSAETRDSNGDTVLVSFDLHAPPGSSRLCLHCPEKRKPSWCDFVVASHLHTVLFRIEVNFDGLWVNHGHAMDYFIYRASSSSAKLTLLPRCFSTEAEAVVDAKDGSSWRHELHMVHSASIGLLADDGDEKRFLVAELDIQGAASTDLLEAKLFRISSSPEAANGVGKWELTHARSRVNSVGTVRFLDVVGWVTHSVIPFSSYLCWADYNRGVLFCDVGHEEPELMYLRLPLDDMPHEDYPKYSRTVCLTDKGNTMKFVKVVRKNSICPSCNPRSGFTISLWTMMVEGYDEKKWRPDVQITCNELWGMKGYDHGRLPRSVPQFPVVSMDDPHILYFVLRGTPVPTDGVTAWIVTLDIERKKVLRYGRIKGFRSDDNISSGFGFFPNNFTSYLAKHSRLMNMVLEKKADKKSKKKSKMQKNTNHASS